MKSGNKIEREFSIKYVYTNLICNLLYKNMMQ